MGYSANSNPYNTCFRALWDELIAGQDPMGPYETLKSLTTRPLIFLNRILNRKSNPFLTDAASCHKTFYPVVELSGDESDAETYARSLAEYHDHCRECKDCVIRYSTCPSHSIKDCLGIGLIAEYLARVNSTKILHPENDKHPRHFVHADGVCRNGVRSAEIGTRVYLVPGKSEREYENLAADSPAR